LAEESRRTKAAQVVVVAAAVVIIVGGLRAAETILIPFLLAAFLSVIAAPPLLWLQRKGMPAVLAVLVVVMILLGIGVGIGAVVGTSIDDFQAALPGYQSRLNAEMGRVVTWLRGLGFEVSSKPIVEMIDPGAAMGIVARVLTGLGAVLANSFPGNSGRSSGTRRHL
jgi:predicted PurR-regulated permease PerM